MSAEYSSAPNMARNRKKPTPTVAIEPLMVNINGVAAITGLSESAIRRAIKTGAFPAPQRLLGCVLWDVGTLKSWVAR